MTVETNFYVMDGKLGVNLNKVITSVTLTANPSQPEYPGYPHKLGDRVQGNHGSEWMLVKASATVSAFNCVAINAAHGAVNVSISHATGGTTGYTFGIAHFQTQGGVSVGAATGGVANAEDLFWALLKSNGGAKVNVTVTTDTGNNLFISSTPGRLVATTGTLQLAGIQTAATVGGATAVEVIQNSYLMPIRYFIATA